MAFLGNFNVFFSIHVFQDIKLIAGLISQQAFKLSMSKFYFVATVKSNEFYVNVK